MEMVPDRPAFDALGAPNESDTAEYEIGISTTDITAPEEDHLDALGNSESEHAEGYPDRITVPDELKDWAIPNPDYNPPVFTSEWVATTGVELGVSDPDDPNEVDFTQRPSFEGDYGFDEQGLPLNPKGRQGIAGRGDLAKHGPNQAADAVVESNGHILLIRRRSGDWAIPGGKIDTGERAADAAVRELREETGLDLYGYEGAVVYEGYVDDPRNTDNSWMETSARYFFVEDSTPAVQGADDAIQAKWFRAETIEELTQAIRTLDNLEPDQPALFASHEDILTRVFRLRAAKKAQ